MRVLHVVPSFYPATCYGGPIHSVLSLCNGLTQKGCEVRVLTTDANGESRLTAKEQNDPTLRLLDVRFCRRIGRGMISPSLLRKLSQDAKWADLIHLTAVYSFPTFPTLLAARLLQKPLVWSPRGTLQRWSGSRRLLFKTVWNSACKVVVPHNTALHVTSLEEGRESSPQVGHLAYRVIPNGVDVPPPPMLSKDDGVLKLLFIGRLDPMKGI